MSDWWSRNLLVVDKSCTEISLEKCTLLLASVPYNTVTTGEMLHTQTTVDRKWWKYLVEERLTTFDLVHAQNTKTSSLLPLLWRFDANRWRAYFSTNPGKKKEPAKCFLHKKCDPGSSFWCTSSFSRSDLPTFDLHIRGIKWSSWICMKENTTFKHLYRQVMIPSWFPETFQRDNGLVVTYVCCKLFPHTQLDICKWSDSFHRNTFRHFHRRTWTLVEIWKIKKRWFMKITCAPSIMGKWGKQQRAWEVKREREKRERERESERESRWGN